jgi:hypothetical protein
MKYTNYAFDFGYAESGSFSLLMMKHPDGFVDPLDGIRDLNNLFQKITASKYGIGEDGRSLLTSDTKECCRKYHPNLEMNVCPICGSRFTAKTFKDLCTEELWFQLCRGTNDSFGGEAWEFLEESKWEVIGPEGGKWVTVSNARNIPDGQGFYINVKGLYDFKYIRENIYE